MKAVLLAATMFSAMATAAQANVIYTFNTTSFGTNIGLPGIPLFLTYNLSDAVVSNGGFTLTGPPSGHNGAASPSNPLTFTGDVNNFTQLLIQAREQVTPNYLFGRISTSLSINKVSGDVTGSSLTFFGVSEGVQISGNGTAASGFLGSDQLACNASLDSKRCFVSGNWTHTAIAAVPEPASLAILGLSVAAFGMMRRKLSASAAV